MQDLFLSFLVFDLSIAANEESGMSHSLLGNWSIQFPILYVVRAVAFAFLIRILLSLLKALERHTDKPYIPFFTMSWWYFKGQKGYSDYWQPFVIGLMELLTFPVLMATKNPSYIGAWIGFKVVAQAVLWTKQRNVFSRFLIGTAFCVLASYRLAAAVTTTP